MGDFRSSALMLARRMLWYQEVGQLPRPLPMVVLLGPSGSGKSEATKAISRHFAWGVVHASFDFDRDGDPPSTVEVIAKLVSDLSQEWRHRPKPRFIRFAIALIALREPLSGASQDQDRADIRERVKNLPRRLSPEELDRIVASLASATQATNLVSAPFVELFKLVLPWTIRQITGRRLDEAMRSLADFPAAEGATPIDALVRLNRLAHQQPADPKAVTAWLTEAFLADVRANYGRMSAPDFNSPCDCVNPERVRHRHAWVLLLDNMDHSSGTEFLADLTTARDNYRMRNPGDRHAQDPLLVLATSGRWQRDWESAWRPPWKPDLGVSGSPKSVPSCRVATYEHWADSSEDSRRSPFYPVLLDPLQISEIADVLGTSPAAPKASLVHRATGGLPSAVGQLAGLLAERTVEYGARDLLGPGALAGLGHASTEDPWYARLVALGLVDQLPDVHLDEFVTAAPFATAPWLIPTETTSRITSQPHIGRILTELRTALWVSAPARDRLTADYVILHPWIATNLVSALAHRETGPRRPSYADQFVALRDDPDTKDPVRWAYCQLALGDLNAVASLFEDDFDKIQHQDWVDRLTLVVRAPDNLAIDRGYRELYEELVNLDIASTPARRSEIRNNIARLIAASWLAANPFVVRGQAQNNEIENAFQALARVSQRPDVDALYDAADRARRGLLP